MTSLSGRDSTRAISSSTSVLFMILPRHYSCVQSTAGKMKGACPRRRGLLRREPKPIRLGVAEVRTATKTTKNGDKHMKTKNKYVGLDVHKDTTVVAVADAGRIEPARPPVATPTGC